MIIGIGDDCLAFLTLEHERDFEKSKLQNPVYLIRFGSRIENYAQRPHYPGCLVTGFLKKVWFWPYVIFLF